MMDQTTRISIEGLYLGKVLNTVVIFQISNEKISGSSTSENLYTFFSNKFSILNRLLNLSSSKTFELSSSKIFVRSDNREFQIQTKIGDIVIT